MSTIAIVSSVTYETIVEIDHYALCRTLRKAVSSLETASDSFQHDGRRLLNGSSSVSELVDDRDTVMDSFRLAGDYAHASALLHEVANELELFFSQPNN